MIFIINISKFSTMISLTVGSKNEHSSICIKVKTMIFRKNIFKNSIRNFTSVVESDITINIFKNKNFVQKLENYKLQYNFHNQHINHKENIFVNLITNFTVVIKSDITNNRIVHLHET